MAKLRGGLFGCGMISEFHLKGWRRIPEVEIVALGNRTIERAEERRRQFAPETRTYSDLGEMLARERLDFIDILTPPAVHLEHCLKARDAGVHIICQKPLCDNLTDAHKLVGEMRAYPKLFAIHENHRYRPWFREIIALHSEGFFGTPRLLRLEQHDPVEPSEDYKTSAASGVLLEYGTHLVDMMRALLGEPGRVYARMHNLNPRVAGESLVHVVFEYPQTTAVVEVAWKPDGVAQGGLLFEGDYGEAFYEGTMTRGESARFLLIQNRKVMRDEARRPYDDYTESFYLLQRECADAMLGSGVVNQTGDENLKTLTSTFAAYESARRGEVVDVNQFARSVA